MCKMSVTQRLHTGPGPKIKELKLLIVIYMCNTNFAHIFHVSCTHFTFCSLIHMDPCHVMEC